ncbi:thiol:disulfide interchange protein DsbA/DsbL [Neisseria animalis]|uniref:Thiol:disulfide interchange protein DsbA/DsbL n=1 Tax=Neisseria animalis TaxID=492 RepID=A0A5P3MTT8_NEIAN|nr:thiol:disulfide interchange protein DsbA/DsbL [Neisseria animalis]QEY24475.1 thiol:disulfide interchange protein DsbA/DsbL [Neisseria animalis]ROW33105.1 thiol:disulfide interchange protein DsbA/DsbL [Neisseria animalis]VEE07148.1 DsbA family thiol:disulfide interchange protein [Neisseria animalis]
MGLKKMSGVLAAVFLLPATAFAATEGVDYIVWDNPIKQERADKVEVLEFFGYFCVHCYELDPVLLKHSQTFEPYAYLRTEHVVWQPEMFGLARVAAAVNRSSLKYQANPAVFDAVYKQRIDLGDEATFIRWAGEQRGFDSKKLLAAYKNPANLAQAKRMQRLTEQYYIAQTPLVLVGGKYQVKFPNGYRQGMKTIDELIQKVRRERGIK